ncbi:MAG: hypothetical protein U1F53_06775 [Burkholderiaceae bacterium]
MSDESPPPVDTPAALPWVEPETYVQARPHVFPSLEAWRYFIRTHRAELVSAEALLRPTGRLLIEPVKFDQVVRNVGLRMANSRSQ